MGSPLAFAQKWQITAELKDHIVKGFPLPTKCHIKKDMVSVDRQVFSAPHLKQSLNFVCFA